MSRSGSDYIVYDLGDWSWDNATIRPIIKTYDQSPETVKSQLKAMRINGQNSISLALWFQPLVGGDYEWHVCDSGLGKLNPHDRANLISVLDQIRAAGFIELHFRFLQQAQADPTQWTTWNAKQFLKNQNFIFSTRSVVEKYKGTMRVIYDLGAELAGLVKASQYCRGIWERWIKAYGPIDATFSLSTGGNATVASTRLNQFFKDISGTAWPSVYLIDCYANQFEVFNAIHDLLISKGQGTRPIYLQECFYNDPVTLGEILKVKAIPGLNFAGVFQWPLDKAHSGSGAPASFNYTPLFDNYKTL